MFGLFRKKSAPAPQAFAPHTNGRTVYAIGDVHGRLDLLDQLLAAIRQDVAQQRMAERPVLIFLGDYVDRGPESRGVLQRIVDINGSEEFETVALMGNHERTALDALAGDSAAATDWLLGGGEEALRSWGVDPTSPRAG